MSDLISRSELSEEIESLTMVVTGLRSGKSILDTFMKEYKKYVLKIIEEQPTVEAVPAVHGEWIHVPSSDMATGKAYECSNCKKMHYGSFLPPFCQMCGADMRKKV